MVADRQIDAISEGMENFEPLSEIPMDKVHELDQNTSRYRSVKDGLPELVKNSKDHYARLGIQTPEIRQIVILISRNRDRLGVLDFGGARPADFEGWKTWSSRNAGRKEKSVNIEAGHGNGGKAFMARGATKRAYMVGYVDGKITRMGFRNDVDSWRYKPGWYKDPAGNRLRGSPLEAEPESVLNAALETFGLVLEDLPQPAIQAFEERQAFTLVSLYGVRDWDKGRSKRLVERIPQDLAAHSQAALTLEMCEVWVQRGDELLHDGPLTLEYPPPHSAFEKEIIPVPDKLTDPVSGATVETGKEGQTDKFLEIRTSETSLRASKKTDLNVIRVRNERNIVANWSVPDLVPMAPSGFLYGTLRVPRLTGDHLAGSGRQELADTALVRALREWTTEQVRPLSAKIQTAQAGRDAPEERETANETLSRMRDLMRDYLESEIDEPGGPDFGERIDEIDLEPNNLFLTAPEGTTVPLDFRCYERDGVDRLPIRNPTVRLTAEDNGLVELTASQDLRIVGRGTTKIWLESEDGDARSNDLEVTCVRLDDVTLKGPEEPLKQGGWADLEIQARDSQGQAVQRMVYQLTVDELDMGRVSRTGRFTAGRIEGVATIRLRYGEDRVETCNVEIGPEETDPREPKTGNIPYLLTCGTRAPGTEDWPEEQRTHHGGEDYPTIIDNEPIWPNVVWLNPTSHEAQKVRSQRGPTGAVGLDTKLWNRFVAMKCFDVLKRLRARQEVGEQQVTSTEFFREMSRAEIECSAFVNEAFELVEEILDGS